MLCCSESREECLGECRQGLFYFYFYFYFFYLIRGMGGPEVAYETFAPVMFARHILSFLVITT